MPLVRQILDALEAIAPRNLAFSFDRVGLQVGNLDTEVKRAVVSLDRSLGAVAACRSVRGQLLLTHHPIIWEPLTQLTEHSHVERSIAELIRSGVSLVAAHTNWDCAAGGVNDALAAAIGLEGVERFGSAAIYDGLKLVTFAPADAIEGILDAAAGAGAGRIGDYSRCAFTAPGSGAFDAATTAHPAVGTVGTRSRIDEVRIEMETPTALRTAVEQAVREAHPYEAPAIEFFVVQRVGIPIGRVGTLPKPMEVGGFVDWLDARLGTRTQGWIGKSGKVRRVGVIGGAADDEWRAAAELGCDAFVTGEVRQHHAVEAVESGLNIFGAGHYATEQPGVVALHRAMAAATPDVAWELYTPEPGRHGRPL